MAKENSNFKDKTIWITGASSGIGKAMAEALAPSGARLILSGRRVKELEALAEALLEGGAKNAKALSEYLIGVLKDTSVTYFCSNIRLDDLPNALKNSTIELEEVVAYNSKFNAQEIDQTVKGVMFYSPSTVDSYMSKNHVNITAYCIGESTAKKAREHFKEVKVAKVPTVEGVIELVNRNYV